MERDFNQGDIVRHFKGNLYQILNFATQTESREILVIYQALYGDFGIFARPYKIFIQKTDKSKYPNAEQEYRFEKVRSSITSLGIDSHAI